MPQDKHFFLGLAYSQPGLKDTDMGENEPTFVSFAEIRRSSTVKDALSNKYKYIKFGP